MAPKGPTKFLSCRKQISRQTGRLFGFW